MKGKDVLPVGALLVSILVVAATALSTLLGSLNGYVFSKWKFPGSEVVFTLFLFGMFIPYQVILIPLFQTLRAMNLYGGLPGLILAHVVYGLPITTLIFRNFYAQIPDSLMESASAGMTRAKSTASWSNLPTSRRAATFDWSTGAAAGPSSISPKITGQEAEVRDGWSLATGIAVAGESLTPRFVGMARASRLSFDLSMLTNSPICRTIQQPFVTR